MLGKRLNNKLGKHIFIIVLINLLGLFIQASPKNMVPQDKSFAENPSLEFLYYVENKRTPSLTYYFANPEICNNKKGFIEYGTYVCELTQASVTSWDYRNINRFIDSSTDVIFFGENHQAKGIQVEFSKVLSELVRMGFNTLAMEMFPRSTQNYLDQYYANEISLEALVKVLEQHWFYDSDGYKEILKAAKYYNVKIIGIDDRESFDSSNTWASIYQRDSFMAQVLAKEILSNQSKIVVYSGVNHAVKSFGDDKEQGLSQKLINNLQKYNIDIQTKNLIFKLASISKPYRGIISRDVSLENQSLVVEIEAYTKYADGIIYLNQNKANDLVASLTP